MKTTINAYTVVGTIKNAAMELQYEERFNNRTGDIDAKTFVKFYIGMDVVGSLSKVNDNKPDLFGRKAEECAKLFQLIA